MARSLWLWLALLPAAVRADDTGVAELLDRIRHNGAVEFEYRETRTLELAATPLQAQGRMLSGVDGSLVKLQLQPKRLVMISTATQLYYWDPQQNQRHSLSVAQAGTEAQPINLFRTILQGHADALRPNYDFTADRQGQHWSLRIIPKAGQNDGATPAFEFSGDDGQNRQRVVIRQADGEASDYQMSKIGEGRAVQEAIQHLLSEATGE